MNQHCCLGHLTIITILYQHHHHSSSEYKQPWCQHHCESALLSSPSDETDHHCHHYYLNLITLAWLSTLRTGTVSTMIIITGYQPLPCISFSHTWCSSLGPTGINDFFFFLRERFFTKNLHQSWLESLPLQNQPQSDSLLDFSW